MSLPLVLGEFILGTIGDDKYITDFLSWSEVSSAFMLRTEVSDTLTFNEESTPLGYYTLTESLSFTDRAAVGSLESVYDSLTFGETSSTVRVKINLISDSLVLTDNALIPKVRTITDSLTITETIVADAVDWAIDNLVITETAQATQFIYLSIFDPLLFTDQSTKKRNPFKSVADYIEFLDQTTKSAHKTVLAEDDLLFDEIIVRQYHSKSITESINLTDSLTSSNKQTKYISDDVVFSDQSISAGNTFNLRINERIRFNEYHTGIAANKHLLLIGVLNSIELPIPEFNDFYAHQNQAIIKKYMDNTFRSMKRTDNNQKIHFDLVVPRPKANEFKQFILDEHKNTLTLQDHNGLTWKVQILNDTVDFIETNRWSPGGNKVRVTVEFLGKIHAGNS